MGSNGCPLSLNISEKIDVNMALLIINSFPDFTLALPYTNIIYCVKTLIRALELYAIVSLREDNSV
jgi:hypothetical protein